MIIENINENNKKMIENFIKKIPTIDEIDKEIFEKFVIVRDEEEVKGIISYEKYYDKGLIRYFIFQKDVSFDYLEMLFNKLKESAGKEVITTFVTVIEDENLCYFFKKLGFKLINVDKIYLSETSLKDTIYRDALGMIYNI